MGADAYVRAAFPGAVRLWGSPTEPFEPDDLDAIWRLGDGGLLAVTALAGARAVPVRRIDRWQEVTAGTRDYVRHAAERLRGFGRGGLGDELEQQMYDDRLRYHEISTAPDGRTTARAYDISDALLLEAILAAVRAADPKAVEDVRETYGEGLKRKLTAALATLGSWPQRAHLVRAVHGNHGPELAPLFEAVLDIPDDAGGEGDADLAREVRAIALADLEADGDFDCFMRYYDDDEAAKAAIRARRRDAGPSHLAAPR
jgi:hypothetical protein